MDHQEAIMIIMDLIWFNSIWFDMIQISDSGRFLVQQLLSPRQDGSTRKKLAKASGCILESLGVFASNLKSFLPKTKWFMMLFAVLVLQCCLHVSKIIYINYQKIISIFSILPSEQSCRIFLFQNFLLKCGVGSSLRLMKKRVKCSGFEKHSSVMLSC